MRRKIVLIDWDDTAVVHGWQCHDEKHNCLAHCQSVGFLLYQDEEGVTLAFGNSDQDLIMERKTIPMGCVKSIRELRLK